MAKRSRPRQLTDEELRDGIRYDSHFRMTYHPEFHFNHGKPLTIDELIYIAKYYENDGRRLISFAIGRTEAFVQTQVSDMRKDGIFEIYKNLSDDEWLKLITPKNRSVRSRKK